MEYIQLILSTEMDIPLNRPKKLSAIAQILLQLGCAGAKIQTLVHCMIFWDITPCSLGGVH
jgi:hypothetical protein